MSESDSSDEFFDAQDASPKANSSRIVAPNPSSQPTIQISKAIQRPESLSLDLEADDDDKPIVRVLPDDITEELAALSRVDEERNSRIAKLEKLRRGEDILTEEDLIDADDVKGKAAALPESTESSVEGIYISGARQSHPFKVIEPEPDRRSVCSDSRSSHGRSTLIKTGHDVSRSEVKWTPDVPIREVTPSSTWQGIPDIVSSMIKNDAMLENIPGSSTRSEVIMGPPIRPPRRAKKSQTPSSEILTPTTCAHDTADDGNVDDDTFVMLNSPKYHFTSTPRLIMHVASDDPLPSPASTVASLTRELEDTLQTLDLQAAMRGQFVVKPQDDEKSRGEGQLKSLLNSLSIDDDDEPLAPLKSRDDSLERQGSKYNSSERKSFKSSDGRRSSSSVAPSVVPLNSQSLGSNYASATSGSSSGGKRSIHSGGSIDSGTRDISGLTKQMNMFLRTKSDSGKRLGDEDILKQIKVKNLDTGEEMNLVEAEDQLPQSINPLSLHIMRLTSEYVSGDRITSRDSDTESMVSSVSGYTLGSKKKKNTVKKFLGSISKRTTNLLPTIEKSSKKDPIVTEDVEKIGRFATEIKSSEGVPVPLNSDGKGLVFKRIQAHKSGPFDFEGIQFAQELSSPHLGPIWCMKFSQCGQLLATAGQDTILRIWVLKNSFNYFNDMRNRYNATEKSASPTNSYENVISDISDVENKKSSFIFMDRPFCQYNGHTSDLLDISWSKNYFILTSSMDKTVRLWHISRRECLCCFQHIDFVTAICFHPRNDQFFLSGSLDGKLRLWNIPDKKVALWNEVDGSSKLITTANFIQNGKFAVVGTYDGRCIFYSTDQLKYYTMIHVRSARGKNAQGRKVTGIEPMPGEDKILVTSNDSRIRLYDLRDLSLSCKYKGYVNSSSQIRASFSHDGKYITAGSENQCLFLWRTHYEPNNLTVRKDRNSYYEAIKAHNAVVTCSVFTPNPQLIFDQLNSGMSSAEETICEQSNELSKADCASMSKFNTNNSSFKSKNDKAKEKANQGGPGYAVISGDYDGGIKVFLHAVKPKHSSLP